MLAAPHTLGIVTTRRCTAACEHCCFACSPAEQDTMPVARMHRYIEQATELPTLKVVVFTGGECFLLGQDLDHLVQSAARQKFMTRFVSNGYWAHTRQAATRRLERLQRSGLSEANFSTGDQHARFVRPEYVRNGALGAADLGMTTVLVFEVTQNSSFPFQQFVDHPEMRRHLESGLIILKLSPWVRFTGNRRISYPERYLREMGQNNRMRPGCTSLLRVLAINSNERLMACCGLTSEGIEELELGSLRRATLRQLISRAPDDFLKIWIHLHGPETVIRYAQRFDRSIKAPAQVVHICEFCKYMYANPRIRDIVTAHPPENMRDIVDTYKRSLLFPADACSTMEPGHTGVPVKQLIKLHRIAVKPSRA